MWWYEILHVFNKLNDPVITSEQISPSHDDLIKCQHIPRYWPLVRGIDRSRWIPHTKASDAELWFFSLLCVQINYWVNNREAGDLIRRRGHYDVNVMSIQDKIHQHEISILNQITSCFVAFCIWFDISLEITNLIFQSSCHYTSPHTTDVQKSSQAITLISSRCFVHNNNTKLEISIYHEVLSGHCHQHLITLFLI